MFVKLRFASTEKNTHIQRIFQDALLNTNSHKTTKANDRETERSTYSQNHYNLKSANAGIYRRTVLPYCQVV
jgi:hypothetical protein